MTVHLGSYGQIPVQTRFLKHIKEDASGCWLWTGNKSKGYGYFRFDNKRVLAHRIAWFFEHGTWSSRELQLDHLCRQKACVNPAHMELVTCRENLMRAPTLQAANARKTHCIHGHEFTPENTSHFKPGRTCITCATLRQQKSQRKRRDAQRKKAS